MSSEEAPKENPTGDPSPDNKARSRRATRIAGLLLIITAILLGWYLLVVYLAWQDGQTLLEERRAQTLAEQIGAQVTLAEQDIAEERYRLAQRRLEWVIQRSPNQPEAQALLREIERRQNPAQTPQPANSPTPTNTPLPTPTPGLISDPASELERIRQLAGSEAWEGAISALLAFQLQYPSYERETTDRLAYNAYLAYGLDLISGDQPEMGIAYLEQAQRLGDLPQEALDYILWARLYLSGIAFYGVNWQLAALNFRELCLAAPFYQGACERLVESLINLGDQLIYLEDWCPAEQVFLEASRYGAAVNQQLGQAREGCANATPTPDPNMPTEPITGTLPTEPITGTLPTEP